MATLSYNMPSSPSKALRQNPDATYKFSRPEARAELRSTMGQKTTIIPLQDMMDHFLTPLAENAKAIPNVFTKVPKFKTEKEMYKYLTDTLNKSGQFNRRIFAATGYKPDPTDPSRQTVDCGMYDSKDAPSEEYTADGSEESRRCLWALVQLLIECKLEAVSQDPFDESSDNNEATADKRREVLGQILSYVELVFKYQQREFVFMVLFLGRCARVVRFDRSGIIASEKIDYTTRGAELTEFLVRYARLRPKNFGHDPTAIRILPTDSLGVKLTQHGAAAAERDSEDHVQKLFNKSLDRQWPWWRLRVDDEVSNDERWFAVGKPHFYAGGVAGRGTRGYVAVPLIEDEKGNFDIDPRGKFVYLKDAWRVDHEGMEKEGNILKVLNDAKVQYIPTLLHHGDLDGQSTASYDLWPELNNAKTREQCPLKSHQHYRLVVAEVGKPLSEFKDGFELVWALYCCIMAHAQACSAGYIHRDISAGNILLCKDEGGHWSGLLNDWELSKYCLDGKTEGGGRQLNRTGTWQFMSVHVLMEPTRLVEIPDDLESFLHVLIYFAVRFLPHNLAEDLIGPFLYSYFDDYTDRAGGFSVGQLKYTSIKRGSIDISTITCGTGGNGKPKNEPLVFFWPQTVTPSDDTPADQNDKSTTVEDKPTEDEPAEDKPTEDNDESTTVQAIRPPHPVNALITELLTAFQAFYEKDEIPTVLGPEVPASAVPDRDVHPALAAKFKAKSEKKPRQGATSNTTVPSAQHEARAAALELSRKIETHAAMGELIVDHLHGSAWPKNDKGEDMKPLGGYVPPKENNAIASTIPTGSKRGAEVDDEESMSKRPRRSRV